MAPKRKPHWNLLFSGRSVPTRRQFLQAVGRGSAAMLTAHLPAAKPERQRRDNTSTDHEKLIPADKKLKPEWLKSLFERGAPTVYRGTELEKIGMPIGGICAGWLYLGGDGKLWHWDIFNLPQEQRFADSGGPNYANPPVPSSPLEQGFALKVGTGAKAQVRPLDKRGFTDITFQGQWPIGTVTYRDRDLPVEVTLEAFSPFIPLNVDDSSLPATVMHYRIKNTSQEAVEVELAGWLENAVCLGSALPNTGQRRNRIVRAKAEADENKTGGFTLLACSAEDKGIEERADKRPDIVFESFQNETYEGWKVEGTAFGRGPVKRSDIPADLGDPGGTGERIVHSHASAPGKSMVERNSHTGKLTSKLFKIERDFINFHIGGGAHRGQTCVNLLIAGKVVHSATGHNHNRMHAHTFDVRHLAGKEACIEIVDNWKRSWGYIIVGEIVFSDTPRGLIPLKDRPDHGTLGLALLGDPGDHFALPDVVLTDVLQEVFDRGARGKADEAARPFGQRLCGALGRRWKLKPGEQADAVFLITWHFPTLSPVRFHRLADFKKLRRHYANHFAEAAHVTEYIANKFDVLASQTRLWVKTWYDSTLPYWLLDRTFMNLSCLATGTAIRFSNGRFYGFEGTYCCDGTCIHVWHYAQAMARIFPELERTTREMVDFGVAFHPDTGVIDYRAEYGQGIAVDGQAGTVLRAYREHQMSADDAFLRRNWPKIKKAIERLMQQDPRQEGLLDGPQPNTMDSAWYGHVPMLSSLYLACLRAGAAMAREMGDEAFARRCDAINDKGQQRFVERMFNGEYFVQRLDPKHLDAIGPGDGCHIDQVIGQGWAFQIGLPRVLPEAQTRSALESLWKYSFTPDVGPYRKNFKGIPGGRWLTMPGEGGLLMCTWPKGGAEKAMGKGNNPWFYGYFNECLSGFEFQVASHMVWEGMLEKGLAITRTIHDRFHAARRNPWNEIDAGDHYSRSMSSYGIFLGVCRFEYHGPKGHIGFAPQLTPDNFRAAFTAAEGWGTFSQKRDQGIQRDTLEVRWGKLRLRTLAFELPAGARPTRVNVRLGDTPLAATHRLDGRRCLVTLAKGAVIPEGQVLEVVME